MKAPHPIALIDCNNFFVSCERLFRPDLLHTPVLVLSSNDGCVVSRSNEVKALGIKMGAPYFTVRDTCKLHDVAVFSSNFDLYRDLSRRVMHTLREMSDEVEVYSVDEAFVAPPQTNYGTHSSQESCTHCHALREWGVTVQHAIQCDIGIPVSVGIAHTKTLAKVATHRAKERAYSMKEVQPPSLGVEVLLGDESIEIALRETSIGDVWGVGVRQTPKLLRAGVLTAADLAAMPDQWVRGRMSVCGLRTVHELRGTRCFGVGEEAAVRKSLLHSQSFAHKAQDLVTVRGAVVYHARKVAEILRSEHVAAREIGILIQSSRHDTTERYAVFDADVLEYHTSDTITITQTVSAILTRIFKPGIRYAKAGVLVRDIIPEKDGPSHTLFGTTNERAALMRTLDTLRDRFGDVMHLASETHQKKWRARDKHMSKRCTSAWNELITVPHRVAVPVVPTTDKRIHPGAGSPNT